MLRIGFSRSAKKIKVFSDLIILWQDIQFVNTKPISHVYGRFSGSSWGRDFIYQSSGMASHFNGQIMFEKLHIVVEEYQLMVPREVEIRIGQLCVDREGKPYAIKQTIGIMIAALAWIITFGRARIKNPLADGDDETNCLEEWAKILSEAMDIEPPPNADQITPWEFRCWLAQQSFVKQVV